MIKRIGESPLSYGQAEQMCLQCTSRENKTQELYKHKKRAENKSYLFS